MCILGCACMCHSHQQFRSPQFFDQPLGSLFVGYVGLPILSPSCDRRGCIENFEFFLNTHCVFPHWFVKRAISILLSRSIDTPPALNLRVYTVSRLNSLVSDYASRGNIDNIRILFKYRQASPFDVNRWGQTPLSVCQ